MDSSLFCAKIARRIMKRSNKYEEIPLRKNSEWNWYR